MKKYLQIDTGGNIKSIQSQQNTENSLLLKEVPDEILETIFDYKLIGDNFVLNIDTYKEKKFKEMNDYILRRIMYVKKTKKLDDVKDLFIAEYEKKHITKEQVDSSISLLSVDLFYI